MPNALIPELNGRQLTVDVALKNPTVLRNQIAKLADDQILLPRLFRTLGAKVTGGGLLYSVIAASDFFTTGVEKRTPGAEYKVVEGVDPEPRLAPLEDWGGKFAVTDAQRNRNEVNYLDQQTTQLANTIVRRLDVAAITALEAANPDSIPVAVSWEDLVTLGPLTDITPSGDRPPAHFAQVQELADLDELGVVLDTLIVNPEQRRQLASAYGPDLGAVLDSAGLTMFSNPRVAAGTAYVCQGGMVGTVGFEAPLTTDTWDDRSVRSTWVQSYCVPAIAVDRPFACKKLTGLSA